MARWWSNTKFWCIGCHHVTSDECRLSSDEHRDIIVFHWRSSDKISSTIFFGPQFFFKFLARKKCRANFCHLSYLSCHHGISCATVVQLTWDHRICHATVLQPPWDHWLLIILLTVRRLNRWQLINLGWVYLPGGFVNQFNWLNFISEYSSSMKNSIWIQISLKFVSNWQFVGIS